MVRKFRVVVNGKEYVVEVEEIGNPQKVQEKPKTNPVSSVPSTAVEEKKQVQEPKPEIVEREEIPGGEEKLVKAPMAGIVLKILVKEGQQVKVGDKLLVFEAMKMENELQSEFSGTVKEILVKEGENIETGQVLMKIV
ncbi:MULTISPECIES: biotin/lipoyl-containing protein [Thermotoga]|uniref:Biotin/lipoyl attachment domain-containing protein n=1 Tax=Thermotoga neapolitana (strain ATCC 49049 / DSM 4359 / NBRC 107923 / NS-E) TaxID=309803 RepID=B9KAR0_THENN|nr:MULTISPECIES: biotin/lipoyl-containing protein [Thermotoga]ACM24043.1 Biotin/lipoyl attachment domain-containing protein [Thermotoga neapolitana DSM 4359]AJG40065.1 propionyl-CoA carboxylase [Thermotoga sp. RQ7]KFZ20835.1 Biotin/lipoyl attachment domain-containing protein [Thermotoga neapolitana LA10]HBF10911.1 acetyl-CoA carboxylase biotin carboxyl carrier protein subunit [Thermotoga neapolitana]